MRGHAPYAGSSRATVVVRPPRVRCAACAARNSARTARCAFGRTSGGCRRSALLRRDRRMGRRRDTAGARRARIMRWPNRSTPPSNARSCKTVAAGPTPLPAAARSSGGWSATTRNEGTPTATNSAPPRRHLTGRSARINVEVGEVQRPPLPTGRSIKPAPSTTERRNLSGVPLALNVHQPSSWQHERIHWAARIHRCRIRARLDTHVVAEPKMNTIIGGRTPLRQLPQTATRRATLAASPQRPTLLLQGLPLRIPPRTTRKRTRNALTSADPPENAPNHPETR